MLYTYINRIRHRFVRFSKTLMLLNKKKVILLIYNLLLYLLHFVYHNLIFKMQICHNDVKFNKKDFFITFKYNYNSTRSH